MKLTLTCQLQPGRIMVDLDELIDGIKNKKEELTIDILYGVLQNLKKKALESEKN